MENHQTCREPAQNPTGQTIGARVIWKRGSGTGGRSITIRETGLMQDEPRAKMCRRGLGRTSRTNETRPDAGRDSGRAAGARGRTWKLGRARLGPGLRENWAETESGRTDKGWTDKPGQKRVSGSLSRSFVGPSGLKVKSGLSSIFFFFLSPGRSNYNLISKFDNSNKFTDPLQK